jgi:hypothetical protein
MPSNLSSQENMPLVVGLASYTFPLENERKLEFYMSFKRVEALPEEAQKIRRPLFSYLSCQLLEATDQSPPFSQRRPRLIRQVS